MAEQPLLFRHDPKAGPLAAKKYAGDILQDGPEIGRVPYTIEQIESVLFESTGIELDLDLPIQMGFERMDWQLMHHSRALFGLFVGKENAGKDPIALQEAEALIAVNTGFGPDRETVVFDAVDLIGTVEDSAGTIRVLGVRYDVTTHQIRNTLISLSNEDKQRLRWQTNYPDRFDQIPTPTQSFTYPRYIGFTPFLLTTEGMVRDTDNHKDALNHFQHKESTATYALEESEFGGGFFEIFSEYEHKVGLRRGFNDKSGGKAFDTIWSLTYPRQISPIDTDILPFDNT